MAASEAETLSPRRQRRLVWWLRVIGLVDLLAIVAVFASNDELAAMHARLDLGTFPDAPIAFYLARSASWLYVLFGVLLWFVSWDIVRYRPLIRFLAACGFASAAVLVGIDWSAGLPWWWIAAEGPCCLLFAAVTWGLTREEPRP